MNQKSPAMRVRLEMNLSPELDIRKCDIYIYFDRKSERYVRIALAVSEYTSPQDKRYAQVCREQAILRWREKYHSDLPCDEDLDVRNADCLYANAIPYDGETILNDDELDFVTKAHNYGDFTLDMLWLIVDGLGWRPGKPVPEDDPGWIVIWAEEEECGGYLEIVRDVLGMPKADVGGIPPAVQNILVETSIQSIYPKMYMTNKNR